MTTIHKPLFAGVYKISDAMYKRLVALDNMEETRIKIASQVSGESIKPAEYRSFVDIRMDYDIYQRGTNDSFLLTKEDVEAARTAGGGYLSHSDLMTAIANAEKEGRVVDKTGVPVPPISLGEQLRHRFNNWAAQR